MINRRCFHQSLPRFVVRGLAIALVVLATRPASAQDQTSSDLPDPSVPSVSASPAEGQSGFLLSKELSGRWEPLGPAPVDQVGSGRRGYALAIDDSRVTAPHRNQFSIHVEAANFFYREQTDDFLVSQRYEAHTLALEYRRGFKVSHGPRFEVGGHVQLHESDGGILNGFISGFESAWVSITGHQTSKNQLRAGGPGAPPQGTVITRDGSTLFRDPGEGSGIGDVYLFTKFALVDGDPSTRMPRVSARVGMNLAGTPRFSEGNYVGIGLSLDQKVLEWLAFHGDVRATRTSESTSVWNLPLTGRTVGFSAGAELRLPRNSSLNLQIDGNSTPYLRTDTIAFDKAYGDVTLALGHRFNAGSRPVTAQFYARENLNLPFQIRLNTDPDLSVGLKVTIH